MGTKLVSWSTPSVSKSARTKVHIRLFTLNNTIGRTGCGKRYKLARAHAYVGDPSEVTCKSCLRAVGSDPDNAN